MNKRYHRIQSKIVNRSISLVIVGLIIMVMLVGGRIAQEEKSCYLMSVQQQMDIVQDAIAGFYERIDQDIQMIATKPIMMKVKGEIRSYKNETEPTFISPSSNSAIEAEIYQIFKAYGENYPIIKYIYLATEDGGYTEWPEVTMPANYDPTKRAWYQEAVAKKGEIIRTKPYIDTTNNMIISSAKAVYDGQGELIGVVGIDVKQTAISNMLANMKIGETGTFMLVHESGMIMADGNNPDNNFKSLIEISSDGLEDALNEELNERTILVNGEEYIANSRRIVEEEWLVISMISKKELSANAIQITKIFTIVSTIMILIIGIYMMVSIRKIILTANLEEISYNTEQLAISMEETATMVEEMSMIARKMQKNINEIASASKNSNSAVDIYINSLQQNVKTITQKTEEKLEEVDKATETVDKINHLCVAVKTIVEQTELFAANLEKETTKVRIKELENTDIVEELDIFIERSKEIACAIQDITTRVTQTADVLHLNTDKFSKFVSSHTANNYAKDIESVQHIVRDYSKTTDELIRAMNDIIESIKALSDAQNKSTDNDQ